MTSTTNSEKSAVNSTVKKKGPGIRAFRPEDITDIVGLMSKIFPRSVEATLDIKKDILSELLLNNPWHDERLPSLVYESRDGKIIGFLGVAPRHMEINGRPITTAISYNLMVDPDSRSTLAGISLVKKFLEGPQDLSMADSATDTSRRLWERLGGVAVPLYSLYWKHPIKPTGFITHHLKKRKYLKTISKVATPLSKLTDGVISRFWNSTNLPEDEDGYIIKRATDEELVQYISRFSKGRSLKPLYTVETLEWLLKMADKPKRFGKLKKEVVLDRNQNLTGWFIYYVNPGGVSEVLQIQAAPGKEELVLTLMINRAKEQGAVGVAGRLDPEWVTVVPNTTFCLYSPGRVWMLAHTDDEEVMQAFKGGDAFISRIEGDLWLL